MGINESEVAGKTVLHCPVHLIARRPADVSNPLRKEDVTPIPALAIYSGTATLPDAEAVKKSQSKNEATQIAGTGHFVMMEKPRESNRVLEEFLQKLEF
jgi:pimeloyl-ACP methyl ester carboxylesterase